MSDKKRGHDQAFGPAAVEHEQVRPGLPARERQHEQDAHPLRSRDPVAVSRTPRGLVGMSAAYARLRRLRKARNVKKKLAKMNRPILEHITKAEASPMLKRPRHQRDFVVKDAATATPSSKASSAHRKSIASLDKSAEGVGIRSARDESIRLLPSQLLKFPIERFTGDTDVDDYLCVVRSICRTYQLSELESKAVLLGYCGGAVLKWSTRDHTLESFEELCQDLRNAYKVDTNSPLLRLLSLRQGANENTLMYLQRFVSEYAHVDELSGPRPNGQTAADLLIRSLYDKELKKRVRLQMNDPLDFIECVTCIRKLYGTLCTLDAMDDVVTRPQSIKLEVGSPTTTAVPARISKSSYVPSDAQMDPIAVTTSYDDLMEAIHELTDRLDWCLEYLMSSYVQQQRYESYEQDDPAVSAQYEENPADYEGVGEYEYTDE